MSKRKTLSEKFRTINARKEKLRIETQLSCTHDGIIYEHKYIEDLYGYSHSPPWRVCNMCGFAEQGWNCGYQILTNKENIIKDDKKAYRVLVGNKHRNDLFVRVADIRNKKTLYEMAIRGESLAIKSKECDD